MFHAWTQACYPAFAHGVDDHGTRNFFKRIRTKIKKKCNPKSLKSTGIFKTETTNGASDRVAIGGNHVDGRPLAPHNHKHGGILGTRLEFPKRFRP